MGLISRVSSRTYRRTIKSSQKNSKNGHLSQPKNDQAGWRRTLQHRIPMRPSRLGHSKQRRRIHQRTIDATSHGRCQRIRRRWTKRYRHLSSRSSSRFLAKNPRKTRPRIGKEILQQTRHHRRTPKGHARRKEKSLCQLLQAKTTHFSIHQASSRKCLGRYCFSIYHHWKANQAQDRQQVFYQGFLE